MLIGCDIERLGDGLSTLGTENERSRLGRPSRPLKSGKGLSAKDGVICGGGLCVAFGVPGVAGVIELRFALSRLLRWSSSDIADSCDDLCTPSLPRLLSLLGRGHESKSADLRFFLSDFWYSSRRFSFDAKVSYFTLPASAGITLIRGILWCLLSPLVLDSLFNSVVACCS